MELCQDIDSTDDIYRAIETENQYSLEAIRDERYPTYDMNRSMGERPEGPDCGVFDFVDLFANALLGRPFTELAKSTIRFSWCRQLSL